MNGNAHTISCVVTGQDEHRYVCSCRQWRSTAMRIGVCGIEGVKEAERQRVQHLAEASSRPFAKLLQSRLAEAERRDAHGRAPSAR